MTVNIFVEIFVFAFHKLFTTLERAIVTQRGIRRWYRKLVAKTSRIHGIFRTWPEISALYGIWLYCDLRTNPDNKLIRFTRATHMLSCMKVSTPCFIRHGCWTNDSGYERCNKYAHAVTAKSPVIVACIRKVQEPGTNIYSLC
jgi:hypothetical protein